MITLGAKLSWSNTCLWPLGLLAVYSFEVLAPKVAKLAAKGPSPELLKAQKLQLRLASTGFALGLIILLLIAIVLSL